MRQTKNRQERCGYVFFDEDGNGLFVCDQSVGHDGDHMSEGSRKMPGSEEIEAYVADLEEQSELFRQEASKLYTALGEANAALFKHGLGYLQVPFTLDVRVAVIKGQNIDKLLMCREHGKRTKKLGGILICTDCGCSVKMAGEA